MKRNQPVSKIMTPDPIAIQLGQRISEARKAMTDGHFHHVPIVDGKKLVGILSSTDILRASYEVQLTDAPFIRFTIQAKNVSGTNVEIGLVRLVADVTVAG